LRGTGESDHENEGEGGEGATFPGFAMLRTKEAEIFG